MRLRKNSIVNKIRMVLVVCTFFCMSYTGIAYVNADEELNITDTTSTQEVENLAMSEGVTYIGTSGYSSTKAENAFDGILDTNWQASNSVGKAPGKYVGVDAGEGKTLTFNKVVIYENASGGEYRVMEFEIQISDDLTDWRKVSGGEQIGENPVELEFDTVTARAVRFCIVRTTGDYKMPLIAEMEIYKGISNSTKISSDVYEIDSENKEIVIFEGDKVSDLTAAINAPVGGSIKICNNSGELDSSEILTEECTVVVTAEDGETTDVYRIKFYVIPLGTNLATLPNISFIGSSGYSATQPEKAFDGDYTTYWQANSTSSGRNVGIDAGDGNTITFNKVTLHEAPSGGVYRVEGYNIEVSNDLSTWTTVATGTTLGAEPVDVYFETQTARAVRFYCTKTTEKMPLIYEMQVYYVLSSNTEVTTEKYYINAENKIIYVPVGTSADEFISNITLPIEATAEITDINGTSIASTTNIVNGSTLTITAQDKETTDTYTIYFDTGVIEDIKTNTNAEDFMADVIALNNKVYTVDITTYDNLGTEQKEKIKNNLFSRKGEIATPAELEDLFGVLVFVEQVNTSDKDGITQLMNDADDILKLSTENYSVFDIYLNRYEATDIISELMGGETFTDEKDLVKKFREETLLYAISKTSNWGEIHNIITADGNLAEFDLTKYNGIKDTSKIDSIFVGQTFESYNAFIDKLSDAIKNYKPPVVQNKPTTSGGGNGGGGASSGGSNRGSAVSSTLSVDINKSELITETKNRFVDLDSVQWAAESIETLAKKDIISGKEADKFYPQDNITREEFVKIIVLAFDINKSAGESSFSDVQPNDWYFEYVNTAYQNDIINGKSAEVFGVGEKITRQDMATIVARAAEKSGCSIAEKYKNDFVDQNEVSDYAAEYVKKLANAGIVNGVGENRFNPLGIATRAEAATLICNLLKALAII